MAKLGKTGRPPAITAIKAHCRECMGFQRDDCEVTHCPLYYWMPYRECEPNLSWVDANAFSSDVAYRAWRKTQGLK